MAERLKDLFFTKQSLNAFADAISTEFGEFNRDAFLKNIYDDKWNDRELKEKMRHVTRCLHHVLPKDYIAALVILVNAAPHTKGFEAMCLPDYVEVYGMDHWEESLNALGHFTRYSSSEFAIRPFLNQDPDITMQYMMTWAKSEHENVRRFASEGCRPLLPWAMALPEFKKDPTKVLRVLELLKDDESEFVRKSVANNLNDISKDNPEIAIHVAESWLGASARTDWIVKHAMRTLLKKGNTRALRMFGFGDPAKIEIYHLQADNLKIKIGEDLVFSFRLSNHQKSNCKIRLEYAIDYVKANGKTARKIFQIIEKEYDPGQFDLKRKQSFKNMTTRKHYPGTHRLSIVVNGVDKSNIEFEVIR
jgi:3-methyladenine DNA glycosylase AlkC